MTVIVGFVVEMTQLMHAVMHDVTNVTSDMQFFLQTQMYASAGIGEGGEE